MTIIITIIMIIIITTIIILIMIIVDYITWYYDNSSHTPRRLTYNIKMDHTSKSTKVLSRDLHNLKTHVKCHLVNKFHLNMIMIGKESKIMKENVKPTLYSKLVLFISEQVNERSLNW